MADLKYPFKRAAWNVANFVAPENEDKMFRNFFVQAGTIGLTTIACTLSMTNVTPDDTVIAGQDARISTYEQHIDALDDFYDNNVETARETWRNSSANDKGNAEAAMNTALLSFRDQATDLLSGLYTERGISETETHALLEKFEGQIGEISSFSFDDNTFPDIGDAAHLHEAQAAHTYNDSELERAYDIADQAALDNKQENTNKVLSPLFGIMGGLFYALFVCLLGMTGTLDALQNVAKRPAPQRNKSSNAFKH